MKKGILFLILVATYMVMRRERQGSDELNGGEAARRERELIEAERRRREGR